MDIYKEAEYSEVSYTCPHCGTISLMRWNYMYVMIKEDGSFCILDNQDSEGVLYQDEIGVAVCTACDEIQIWLNQNLIYPIPSTLPIASVDMPEKVRVIYNEAKEIFSISPRASAALLRLGLQYLCKELGESGENINNDIKSLVGKGLPDRVQKALDTIRVIGNSAVHPGTININEKPEVAQALFKILNIIVEKMVTEPKQIDEIYDLLPEGAKRAIEKRDSN